MDGSKVIHVGKALGEGWAFQSKEPPTYVRELASRVAHYLVEQGGQGESQPSEIEVVILAQARRSRNRATPTAEAPLSNSIAAVIGKGFLAELRSEERARLGPLGDLVYRHPVAKALETAMRFEACDSELSVEDAEVCIAEIGRLAGPLAPRRNLPKEQEAEAKTIARSLETILRHLHGETDRIFDEGAGEYRSLTSKELKRARKDVRFRLNSVWFKAFLASNEEFCSLYPFDGPLPKALEARLVEQDRRATERMQARERGVAAIQEMVEPILRGAQTVDALERERLLAAKAKGTSRVDYPTPAPQPYGVSARGAELWVADALRWLGAENVEVTQQSGDGGVDVLTSEYAVSVKHYAGMIPVEEVREIFGVSMAMRLMPMLWTSGSLTRAGAAFADVAPVPVFHYAVMTAKVSALNQHAHELLDRGL